MQDISRLHQEQLNRFLKGYPEASIQFADRSYPLFVSVRRVGDAHFYVTTCCPFFQHPHPASWNEFAASFHVLFFEVPKLGLSHCKEKFQRTSLKSPFGRMPIDSSPSKLGSGSKTCKSYATAQFQVDLIWGWFGCFMTSSVWLSKTMTRSDRFMFWFRASNVHEISWNEIHLGTSCI